MSYYYTSCMGMAAALVTIMMVSGATLFFLFAFFPMVLMTLVLFLDARDTREFALETKLAKAFPDTRPSLQWYWVPGGRDSPHPGQYRCREHNSPVCDKCGPFLDYLKEAHSWSHENCEECGLHHPPPRLPPAEPKPRPDRPKALPPFAIDDWYRNKNGGWIQDGHGNWYPYGPSQPIPRPTGFAQTLDEAAYSRTFPSQRNEAVHPKAEEALRSVQITLAQLERLRPQLEELQHRFDDLRPRKKRRAGTGSFGPR